jgi:hypothetical protein
MDSAAERPVPELVEEEAVQAWPGRQERLAPEVRTPDAVQLASQLQTLRDFR